MSIAARVLVALHASRVACSGPITPGEPWPVFPNTKFEQKWTGSSQSCSSNSMRPTWVHRWHQLCGAQYIYCAHCRVYFPTSRLLQPTYISLFNSISSTDARCIPLVLFVMLVPPVIVWWTKVLKVPKAAITTWWALTWPIFSKYCRSLTVLQLIGAGGLAALTAVVYWAGYRAEGTGGEVKDRGEH